MFFTTRSLAMVVLVARSKLVPDFALTIHFLHLLFTCLYTRSLPRHSMWWFTMLASAATAVGLGMWGCRYRELQPVFFLGGRILGSGTSGPAKNTKSSGAMGDPDVEDGMGESSSMAGEYEMGQMKPST